MSITKKTRVMFEGALGYIIGIEGEFDYIFYGDTEDEDRFWIIDEYEYDLLFDDVDYASLSHEDYLVYYINEDEFTIVNEEDNNVCCKT